MQDDPLIWLGVAAAVAVVVGLAVWKGRRLNVRWGGLSAELKEGSEPQPPEGSRIRVAEDLDLKRARVGDVAGIKTADAPSTAGHDIEVAQGARLRDAQAGDIVGIVQTPSTPKPEDKDR